MKTLLSERKLLKSFSRVSYFRERKFRKREKQIFLKNKLAKTVQKDIRNFRDSKVIVIIIKIIILWKKSMNSFFCNVLIFRRTRPQIFFKIDVLKNFANFTGKHLCGSLFSIKLQSLRSANLLKMGSNIVTFLWNWWSFFMNSFFYGTPPVAAPLVFVTQQRNFQCYNDNFGL